MDSLSQIVLGAAVGEAALGRKVGNRAIVWGAIAGTLPDLDVLANAVTDPLSALAYHRAFTHSLPFAVLAAPLIGLLVHRLYAAGESRLAVPLTAPPPPAALRGWPAALLFIPFFLLLLAGSYFMPIEVYEIPGITATITVVFAAIVGVIALRERLRKRPSANDNASWRQWSLLFFLAIVTHPLLDCFTAYGTQFFEPFSKTRIAWNTISVVDPLYTLPFLLFLAIAFFLRRGSRSRRRFNRVGLVLSSVYLLFTVVNHFNVAGIMENTLADRSLTVRDYRVSPSILNNILWQGTARAPDDETFYYGSYSLLDRERSFSPFQTIAGNHDLLAAYHDRRELRILRWFTQGYYGIIPLDEGKWQFNDLRYATGGGRDTGKPNNYVFFWIVQLRPDGTLDVYQPPPGESFDGPEMLDELVTRIKGI
ncbi:MAG: metal-dependent hydrolase [Saprospiraceae bacterium]